MAGAPAVADLNVCAVAVLCAAGPIQVPVMAFDVAPVAGAVLFGVVNAHGLSSP
jgi:hypothetical protein